MSCLLDYPHFKEHYGLIAIDLSKQQGLDANAKAIQQISFTGSLERAGNTTMFFVAEEAKEPYGIFHKELWKYYKSILL